MLAIPLASALPETVPEGFGLGGLLAFLLFSARYLIKNHNKTLRRAAAEILAGEEAEGRRQTEITARADAGWESAIAVMADALHNNQETNSARISAIEIELATTKIELANTRVELAQAQAAAARDRALVADLQEKNNQISITADERQRYIKLLESRIATLEEQLALRDAIRQAGPEILKVIDERLI